jgi:16S rRNA (guanine527-N7)-methyltransferase
MEISSELKNILRSLCISTGNKEINSLLMYLELLYTGNKELNLTGTKDKNMILVRHIFDSLGIFQFFDICGIGKSSRLKIIDVGTGAGLPGIPIAIFLKHSEISLLDSKKKITDFLASTACRLQLLNTRILAGRAEVLANDKEFCGAFDIVTARAVANVSTLAELTIPFCRVGGKAVLYKSRKLYEELAAATPKINALGAKVEDIVDVKIPLLDEYRTLLILKKEFPTLYKYPGKYGKIFKS